MCIRDSDNTLITCIAGFLSRFNDSSIYIYHPLLKKEFTDLPKLLKLLIPVPAFCIFPYIRIPYCTDLFICFILKTNNLRRSSPYYHIINEIDDLNWVDVKVKVLEVS